MKKINKTLFKIMMFCVIWFVPVNAQHRLPVNADKLIAYKGEIKIDSVKQELMAEKATEWLRAHYFSGEVVQDETDKSLVVRGFFRIPEFNEEGTMYHECRIKLDKGNCAYMFHNFIYTEPGGISFPAEAYPAGWKGSDRFYELMDNGITLMIEDLQNYMANAPTENQ
jgi:hypothetical protein